MPELRVERRPIGYAISAAVLAVACLIWHAKLEPSMRGGQLALLEYGFIFLSTISLFNLYRCSSVRLHLRRILETPWLIFVCAAFLFFSIRRLGMHQFGGFDESFLVNITYHYLKGFRPIADWPSPMPPLFMAGLALIAHFQPFRFFSFSLFNAVFAVITCFWIFGLLRMVRIERHWALAITVAIELSTAFVLPFWWYNNSTSLVVILLLLSVIACEQEPHRFLPWLSLSASFGMVICAKPNVAFMWMVPFVLLLDARKSQWLKTVLSCLSAVVIALSICTVARISPAGLIGAYAEAAKLRGNPLLMLPFRGGGPYFVDNLVEAVIAGVLVMCTVDLLAKTIQKQQRCWPLLLACSITAFTCLEMVSTNRELKMVDLVVMLVVLFVLVTATPGTIDLNAKPVLVPIIVLFIVWSGYLGLTHMRILGIGQGFFYEPLPTHRIESGFLAGLQAGPRLIRIQDQVADALSRHPADKVFFGPLLEFEYPVFQKDVIPSLPVQWDPGNQYSPAREPELLENFKREDPDLLIILKHDYIGLENIADYIQHAPIYEIDDSYSEITLYIRKKPPQAQSVLVLQPVRN
jgi:hypothetical protein